jgi:hypothetical protein
VSIAASNTTAGRLPLKEDLPLGRALVGLRIARMMTAARRARQLRRPGKQIDNAVSAVGCCF